MTRPDTDPNISDTFDTLDQTIETHYLEEHSVPYMVVLSGDTVGKVIRLKRYKTFKAGRVHECELCFDCENISRRHASLEVDGKGQTRISDLNSTNGTLVNGKRIKSVLLEDGDRVCMGDVVLRYSYKSTPALDLLEDFYNKATRDTLTGLFNKRYFMEDLKREFAFHKRQKLPFSILLFELTDIGPFSATFGEANGDIVLQSMADEIRKSFRREDTLARLGGEEFGALFRCTSRTVAVNIGQKLVDLIHNTKFTTPAREFSTGITLGLVTLENDNFQSAEDMLLAADRNLLRGRAEGKSMVIR